MGVFGCILVRVPPIHRQCNSIWSQSLWEAVWLVMRAKSWRMTLMYLKNSLCEPPYTSYCEKVRCGDGVSDPGDSPSSDIVPTSTLILGFRASKTKKCISVPHTAFRCVVLMQQPVWTAASSTQHFNITLWVHFHCFALYFLQLVKVHIFLEYEWLWLACF